MAGRWLFGDENVKIGKVKIIRNAIEVEKYQFDASIRNSLRKVFNLENDFIVGHVVRFKYQKNHMFF
ncbi:hypothetical protein LL037_24380 [Clostridium estertheticum]|uniref:hypothetical protein n=1 Tax=Clostridium estertheticum TaxID=238834 RepID=UPI001C0B054E|nr:hypothetical protein [Clostridium estertheticum]MBU3197730.1 hypothetical protein [Clostridium estertheticum]WAG65532.1 hypothetical protein LL037_24380 [Clostridium estertheticum]